MKTSTSVSLSGRSKTATGRWWRLQWCRPDHLSATSDVSVMSTAAHTFDRVRALLLGEGWQRQWQSLIWWASGVWWKSARCRGRSSRKPPHDTDPESRQHVSIVLIRMVWAVPAQLICTLGLIRLDAWVTYLWIGVKNDLCLPISLDRLGKWNEWKWWNGSNERNSATD